MAEWSKAAVLKLILADYVHYPENAENSLFSGLYFTSVTSACTLYKGAEKGVASVVYTRSCVCTLPSETSPEALQPVG